MRKTFSAFACLAMWCTSEAHAIDPDLEPLTGWAHEGPAQRNRVAGKLLPEQISSELLAILAEGARPCECRPRKLRWAWSLPLPHAPERPAIVVAFEDRPREHAQISLYERYALIRFRDGKYRVASVLTLRRPHADQDASLKVSIAPRRDFDDDGQLDIVLTFEELFPNDRACAEARFVSHTSEMLIFERACQGARDKPAT